MILAAAADPRAEYHSVSTLYLPIAGLVFVIVAVALAIPLYRDRASRKDEPSTRLTSTKVEAAFAVLLAVIAGGLAWRSLAAVAAVRPVGDEASSLPAGNARVNEGGDAGAGVVVHAVAAKWNWRFEYPGGVVSQGTSGSRLGVLTVPTGERVRIRLDSRDVIHALWIPKARAKYDAIPGYTNVFDVRFEPRITYDDDRCSEFCGEFHSQMLFDVRTLPPAQFAAWLRGEQRRVAGQAGAAS